MRSAPRFIVALLFGFSLQLLGCSSDPGPADCAGVEGGSAFLDDCGACVGGRTGLGACVQDCAGVWGGAARRDDCGACVGGTTGRDACAQDCAHVWGGTATRDECGQCVGGTTGVVACVQDCAGVWGGAAALDHCGVCAGGATGAIACAQDCAGVWGGTAALDPCGACVGGTTGKVACAQDCAGEWGGTAALDRCGACVGGTTGKIACVQDCVGVWGGTAALDHCGACAGGTTGKVACAQDCAGEWGGTAALDRCGACVGGTTGKIACAQDCAGVWGGTAALDHCGACVGGTTGKVACAQDCAGEWGGTAALDRCGACAGGTTGKVACAQDCAGTWGGSAQADSCSRCTGGTTGRLACADGVCRLGPGETVQGLVDNPACAVVELPAGTFRGPITVDVTRMGGKRSVEIRGASRDATVFQGTVGQMFWVKPDTSARLARLTIRETVGLLGAAIYNEGAASLDDVAITNNTGYAGAVIANTGQLEIQGASISGNVNQNGQTALGGAIYNSGALYAGGTSITGNSALGSWEDYGGAICNDGGSVILEDSEIAGNLARATVSTGGSLEGGGIFSYFGTVDVRSSRIHHNRVEHVGSGAHGGGISAWGSVVSISPGSEVSFNEVVAKDEAYGAGIYVEQGTTVHMDGVAVEGNVGRAEIALSGAAVYAKQTSLTLAGTRLAGNRLEVTGTYSGQIGGGVVSVGEGILTISGGQIVGNTMVNGVVEGGLIQVVDMASPSEEDEALHLRGVEIADNVITTRNNVSGGLVWAVSRLTIEDCDIHSNTVTATSTGGSMDGGLVYYIERRSYGPGASTAAGELLIRGTHFDGNTVADASYGASGGLLHLRFDRLGPVVPTVAASTFVGNSVATRSWMRGGVVYLEEARHVRISDSVVSGNAISAGVAGGAASTIDGGLFHHVCTVGSWTDPDPDGMVELVRTDVSQNQIGSALATDVVRGGVATLYAPWHVDGRLFTYAATNATFSRNAVHARSKVDGALVNVFNKAGAEVLIALNNTTVALNDADGPLGSVFDFEYPPTDYRPAVVQLRNTILARNAAGDGADCPIHGPLSQALSWGYNVLGDVSACAALTPAATDLVGLDPLLGEYGDHGGLVPSIPVVSGSPAIDGGDPAGCVDLDGVALSTDQRGLPRPAGAGCDVGAFEVQGI